MKNPATAPKLIVIAITSSVLAVQGCIATHGREPGPRQAKTVMSCRGCYELALMFQHDVEKRRPWTMSKTRALHMCDGCKAHIELYTLDGKPMIRCPRCAPVGQACDKCLPPEKSDGTQRAE